MFILILNSLRSLLITALDCFPPSNAFLWYDSELLYIMVCSTEFLDDSQRYPGKIILFAKFTAFLFTTEWHTCLYIVK